MEIKPALEKIPMIIRFSARQRDTSHPIPISASAFWLGCNNVAREVVSARPILSRERRSGLNTPAYLTSIYGAQMMIALLQMSIIVGFCMALCSSHIQHLFAIYDQSPDFECGHLDWLIDFLECSLKCVAISTVPIVLIPQLLLLGGYIKIYGRLQVWTRFNTLRRIACQFDGL